MTFEFPNQPWPFILLAISITTVFSSWMISKESLSIKDKLKQKKERSESGKSSTVEKDSLKDSYKDFRRSYNKLAWVLSFNNLSSIILGLSLLLYIISFVFKQLIGKYFLFDYSSYLNCFIVVSLCMTYLSIVLTILYAKRFFGFTPLPPPSNSNGMSFVDPLDEKTIIDDKHVH